MDQIMDYPTLIKQALSAYVSLLAKSPHPTYEVVLAFDDQHQQYLVRKLGWANNRRIRYVVLHISFKNDKIWIEEDMTEEGIATYFLEQGVPRE
ncbi:MAG: XisI protein, partial [candidate division Zixibacteria bacterium]|nr:XisI protein [candidate division Zixibacteria bacterium]